jgi:hypothetical protein
MSRRFSRFLGLCALGAPALQAQSILDLGARTAPQFHSYTIDAPSNTKISEFSVPLFVLVPIAPSFSFDVGTSYAQSRVEQTNNGTKVTSSISGLTDTQIRGNLVLGRDFIVLTAGVNLPTGKSTVATPQQLAASLIGSDFLAFPISNMGTGLGGTGGIAVARPLGDWNFGFGFSMRRSAQYDPFDAAGGTALHYQPGNEYRGRAGLDRAVGTGRITLGVTYSTFGSDNLGGSLYNTGDRWLSQASYANTLGGGQLSFNAWDLFRTAGTLADSSTLGHENIVNGALAYGIPIGNSVTLEPNIEGRAWTQESASTSALATFGLRMQIGASGFSILPSVAYSLGRLAAQDVNGLATTATMTGFHGILAIRLR